MGDRFKSPRDRFPAEGIGIGVLLIVLVGIRSVSGVLPSVSDQRNDVDTEEDCSRQFGVWKILFSMLSLHCITPVSSCQLLCSVQVA